MSEIDKQSEIDNELAELRLLVGMQQEAIDSLNTRVTRLKDILMLLFHRDKHR